MGNHHERAAAPAHKRNARPYLDRADVVIIGNGIAGLTAAVEARRLAPEKRIVMITDQIHPTINTPALKQFAIGKLSREQLLTYPAGTERSERIHVVTAHVEEIHANSKYVTLDGKRGFGYDALLLATGSTPQGLPASTPGLEFDGVITLHRLQDYLDLRRRLSEVSEAVVIGGGAHAIETVMGLNYWGIHVHWLIRGDTFMSRILDETASDMVLERIRRSGVTIHTGTEVVGVVGRVGTVVGVITTRQEMLPCQLVAICTGTNPQSTLATRCTQPLRRQKGIVVDDQLRTSVPHIYAAGDVAALKNPQTNQYEPRAQWYSAVTQGRIAGAMLAGQDNLAQQFFGVQWQATHLGALSMLTVGNPLYEDPQVEVLTDKTPSGYRRLSIKNDQLIGYLSLGKSQPDSLAIKRIIDEGHAINTIKAALLKGKFDARQHLLNYSSRTAQGMLTTGKLPDPRAPQQLPVNPQLTPQPPTLPPYSLVGDAQSFPLRPYTSNEDEISPFTGNLPHLSQVSSSQNTPLPAVNEGSFSEELSPFSGNLPSPPQRRTERLQNTAQKLWSYANTAAPVHVERGS